MEFNDYVLGLLESILGVGKKDRHTFDYAFYCPFCNHKKPKLIVNTKTGKYNCWTCQPPTKGKTPVSLLIKLGAEDDAIKEMKGYFKDDNTQIEIDRQKNVFLPQEFETFTSLDNSLERRRAIAYLKMRCISMLDVLKYNIGYCKTGRYKNKIIIPSYNKVGKLNYFVARSFEKDPYMKYDAPSVTKTEIIGMEYSSDSLRRCF